jgi:hypothetical protein
VAAEVAAADLAGDEGPAAGVDVVPGVFPAVGAVLGSAPDSGATEGNSGGVAAIAAAGWLVLGGLAGGGVVTGPSVWVWVWVWAWAVAGDGSTTISGAPLASVTGKDRPPASTTTSGNDPLGWSPARVSCRPSTVTPVQVRAVGWAALPVGSWQLAG